MALILTGLGLRLAEHKPLWNDELYSLLSSVRNLSYGDIITAKITEGNNTPLFYLSQKAFIDLTGYQPPQEWVAGQWGHNHPYSNLRIRILPVACMSVAIAVIFYFFSYFYSIWTGLYALAVAFSSFMVWAYGFEARPYALWFLLTTLQAVFF